MGSDWLEEEWVCHQYQCLVSWDNQIREGNLKKIQEEQEVLLTQKEQLEGHLEDHFLLLLLPLHHQMEVLLEDLANLLLEEEDQRLEKGQEETVLQFLLRDMYQEILLTQQQIR